MRPRAGPGLAVLLLAAAVAACTRPAGSPSPGQEGAAPATGPTTAPTVPVGATPVPLRVEVIRSFPHDPTAFTQGLFLDEGMLFESTGLHGASSLRRVDPETGELLQQVAVDPEYFAEGLARAGDRLIQLTWQNGVALVYDRESFEPVGRFDYDTEGWGLCHDGRRLVMSDGTPRLYFRDPETFELLGELPVSQAGAPVANLNELECVGNRVLANVWQTDRIVSIDPATGAVEATIDASGLLGEAERAGADVLNGIAFDPASGHYLITGKLWPKLFEVRFVPAN